MTRLSPEPTSGTLYAHKWQVMTAVGLAALLGTVDVSIVNIALPTIVAEFDTSFGAVQWVVLSYLLTQATLVLGMGRLADIAGRKVIFVTGFFVFIVGSMLSGLSPGVGWLILFRIVQGIGAAMIFSIQFALITESFPPAERGRALGLNSSIVSIGIISGPILGGLIIDTVDWRWIFYVNVPIGIIGILAALRYIPHTKPQGGERFDFLGGSLFLVGLLALLLGLTWGQDRGFGDSLVVGLYATAVLALIAFVIVETVVDHPMLDLHMFRSSDFTVSLLTRFATFVAMGGVVIVFPFFLTNVLELRPRGVGLVLAALPFAMGVSSPLAGSWSDRKGPRKVSMVGLVVLVAAFGVGNVLIGADSVVWMFLLMTVLIGLGFGTFTSPNNSAVMGSAASHRLGVASSLITITRITGWVTGVAVIGTIWAVRTEAYAGGGIEATEAPAAAQASGFSDVLIVVVIVVASVALLSLWTWRGRWNEGLRDSTA